MLRKAEFARLEEQVGQIDPAALDGPAKVQFMATSYPAKVVGPGEIVANELPIGLSPKSKPPFTRICWIAFIGWYGRLTPSALTSERVRGRSTSSVFPRIAETGRIHLGAAEHVSFVNQRHSVK